MKGFAQVIVGAGIQPGDAVFGGVPRREDQHRQVRAAVAQASQHLQAIHARQAEIEHHHVKGFAEQGMQGTAAVLQPIDGVALTHQRLVNTFTQCHVILDQ